MGRGKKDSKIDILIKKEYGGKIKIYRKKHGLTQRQLAEKVGVAPSTITMYETGKRFPDFETELKIADVLNEDFGKLRKSDIQAPALEIMSKKDHVRTNALRAKFLELSEKNRKELEDYLEFLHSKQERE